MASGEIHVYLDECSITVNKTKRKIYTLGNPDIRYKRIKILDFYGENVQHFWVNSVTQGTGDTADTPIEVGESVWIKFTSPSITENSFVTLESDFNATYNCSDYYASTHGADSMDTVVTLLESGNVEDFQALLNPSILNIGAYIANPDHRLLVDADIGTTIQNILCTYREDLQRSQALLLFTKFEALHTRLLSLENKI